MFRVREKGVRPVRGGAAGDLFCRVVVETPVGLGAEQRELLKKFEASLQEGSHRPREQSFFEGVKKFLHRRDRLGAGMHSAAVFGITGRMGQSLVQVLRESPDLRLSGAIASAASGRLGQDAALGGAATGVAITADPAAGLRNASVALDFSTAAGVAAHVGACVAARVPLLIGTTGLDAAGRRLLDEAAKQIPVLIAPNTSVGVGVVARLVSLAAGALSSDFDVEIAEAHHRLKRDAPSGTALALGEAWRAPGDRPSRTWRPTAGSARAVLARPAASVFRCCARATSSASTR